jgi:hypothetical protein
MPLSCMVQILSRLHPADLSSAGSVCRRWRQCVEYAWLEIRKVQLNISSSPNSIAMNGCNSEGFLPFVLRKCPNLHELSLVVSRFQIRLNMSFRILDSCLLDLIIFRFFSIRKVFSCPFLLLDLVSSYAACINV